MEATTIEKKKLDDARFVVPPDYQVVDMAQLMAGMMPPGAMPPGAAGNPRGLPPGFTMPSGFPSGFVPPPRKR